MYFLYYYYITDNTVVNNKVKISEKVSKIASGVWWIKASFSAGISLLEVGSPVTYWTSLFWRELVSYSFANYGYSNYNLESYRHDNHSYIELITLFCNIITYTYEKSSQNSK